MTRHEHVTGEQARKEAREEVRANLEEIAETFGFIQDHESKLNALASLSNMVKATAMPEARKAELAQAIKAMRHHFNKMKYYGKWAYNEMTEAVDFLNN